MNKIYLVRHGETDWNYTGKYQGSTNVPLNAKGLEQADKCAQALSSVKIDRIIASTLDRAVITAKKIQAKQPKEVPLKLDYRLQEVNFGDWEGLTYDEINAKWPGEIEVMYRKASQVKIQNGETFQQVQDRAWNALKDEIDDAGEDKTILVVCHGGTIRTIICKLLNLPLDYSWNLSQGNTAITCMYYYGMGKDDHNLLYYLNNLNHIQGL